MIGRKFGRLTVISGPEKTRSGHYWLCTCDCGGQARTSTRNLRTGITKSCGCFRASQQGLSGTPLHSVWSNMRRRCADLTGQDAADYALRGITVCSEWEDFSAFRSWALSHNYAEGLQIDRRNNDGNYSPENCRFVSSTINAQNKRLIRKTNKTGFAGVSWHQQAKKYACSMRLKGHPPLYRHYPTARAAAVARDAYVLRHELPMKLNFPELALQGPL